MLRFYGTHNDVKSPKHPLLQIQWTSEGLANPVAVSILGPAQVEVNGTERHGEPLPPSSGGRVQFATALPSAGSLMASLRVDVKDMPAGDGYSIEVGENKFDTRMHQAGCG